MSNRILVVAATELEIAPCRTVEGCDFVVTGMGATNTVIALVWAMKRYQPRFVIQIGIAGAVDKSLNLGQAYYVCSDYQADLGAWRDGAFVPFGQMVYRNENYTSLTGVSSRSVTTACTERLTEDEQVQMESMEGAAFFQTMLSYGNVRFAQVRSVSNYIDMPRNLWCIDQAVAALPEVLKTLL